MTVALASADPAAATDELSPELKDLLTGDEKGSPATSPDTGTATAKSSPDDSAAGTGDPGEKPGQQASEATEKGDAEKGKAGDGGNGDGSAEEVKVLSQAEIDARAAEALGLSDKDPNSAETWKTRHDAQTKVVREQGQRLKSIEDRLGERGLKVLIGKEGKAEFVQDGEFREPIARDVSKTVRSGLSKEELDLALEKPNDLIDLVVERTLEASAQEYPTALKEDVKLDERLHPAIRLDMINAKDAKGEPKFPDYETLEPYIDRMLADETTPDAFRDFITSNEANRKMGLAALYGLVHMRVAPIIAANLDAQAQAAEKKKSATEDASLTSEGTRGSSPKKPATEEDEADEIVNAKPLY